MSLVLALLMLFASLPAGAWAFMEVAVEATRIAIHFDGQASSAQATLMESPRRIAVDVRGTGLGDASGAGVPAVPADGPVRAIRRQRIPGGARFVFDLRSPAVVADGGLDAEGRELVLSLQPVDAARFAQVSAAGPLDFLPLSLRFTRRSPYKVSIPVPPPKKGPPLPRVRGGDRRPLVVIDAGHGGVDPGAINPVSHLREKDVTLRIARAIRDELLDGGRVRVALTRDSDKYLVLRERYGIARRLKADLFISIHCDSVGQAAATGASVYTLSDVASDREAARLATRENKADVIAGVNLGEAGDDVSSILIDLTRRETMNNSADFARLLGREARDLVPMKPGFHRMASLMVLKAPDMPSILFETGYISNPQDAAFLDSSKGRERIAESVRRAVEVHFARRMGAG
ncbi:N-acetylmuramoyl-L-alanine amidase family protein [Sphingomonas sp. CFBP 8760]|uniref:N-acetylmuramoyl-L-alanine amidase family protein n=1 Tax=Sphingomonas sp. CFBP 8760 TaxID=2775282 RepID=UPI00177AB25F|nr:N-acetylmuramoyl-L-alanine amidase [Sphingomonas sp. CFBP 8760]MBD8545533.1 N-acetylmuramoyl-L-alanine amidase [Sphingomonas sp. CFBP 8760]